MSMSYIAYCIVLSIVKSIKKPTIFIVLVIVNCKAKAKHFQCFRIVMNDLNQSDTSVGMSYYHTSYVSYFIYM